MVLQTGEHPAKLKDIVTTPAGCTVDGLLELEEGGLRVTLIKAVVRATQPRARTGQRLTSMAGRHAHRHACRRSCALRESRRTWRRSRRASRELEKLGLHCQIVIPRYRSIDLAKFGFRAGCSRIRLGSSSFRCPSSTLAGLRGSGIPDRQRRFFGREGIYIDPVTGKDYPDQADRWIFFQRAAMEFFRTALPNVDISIATITRPA